MLAEKKGVRIPCSEEEGPSETQCELITVPIPYLIALLGGQLQIIL